MFAIQGMICHYLFQSNIYTTHCNISQYVPLGQQLRGPLNLISLFYISMLFFNVLFSLPPSIEPLNRPQNKDYSNKLSL